MKLHRVVIVICSLTVGFALIRLFWPSPTREATLREAPVASVDSLLQIAEQKTKVRKMDEALDLASRALRIARKQTYRHGEVKSLRIMGFAIEQQAEYDSSIALLQKARTLGEQYRVSRAERGFVAHYLGSSYLWKGEFHEALGYYREALDFFTASDTLIGIIMVHHGMGLAYAMQAFYSEATTIWEQGLALAKTLPGKHYYELALSGNLGKLYQLTGQIDNARVMIEGALRMAREFDDRRAEAVALEMLGEIESTRGNLRSALRYFLKAAQLREEIDDVRGTIQSYLSLAGIYDILNDYEKAEYYYQQGVDAAGQRLTQLSPIHVHLHRKLGWHWVRRSEFALAEEAIQKAIAGAEKLNLREELGKALLALAVLRIREKKYEDCLEIADSALSLAEDVHSAIDIKVHLYIGIAQYALGKRATAFEHFNQAIKMARERGEAEIIWQAYFYLARYYRETGDLAKAARFSENALMTIEQLRRYTLPSQFGSYFLADKLPVYWQYFDTVFELYQREKRVTLLDSLFILSEKTRSRALFDVLQKGEENIFFQLQESSKLQELEEQIVSLNLLLRKAKNKNQSVVVALLSEHLNSLKRAYARQASEFTASRPELTALLGVSSQRVTLPELQKMLSSATAFISYYFSLNDVYALVVTAKKADIFKLEISPHDLWNQIRRLRKPFQEFKEGRTDFLRLRFDAELSYSLFQMLIVPFAEFLENTPELIIVPAGPLTYLPFELLVTENKQGASGEHLFDEYKNYGYLIEKFTIRYLPAGTILPLLKGKKMAKTSQTLLAFGNPVPAAGGEQNRLQQTTPVPSLHKAAFRPLPLAGMEIQSIGTLFEKKQVLALSGEHATESAYKQKSGHFRFIHFATHGLIDEKKPNFSALLLNPTGGTEDGYLYAHEIYVHPLNSELVSLSACETALGQYREGEGLSSFIQPFFAAGSRAVMASLWSVEEATYPLMVAFYKNLLSSKSKAEALRQAKLEFMQGVSQNGQQEYSQIHPFLWAPFVLYGLD